MTIHENFDRFTEDPPPGWPPRVIAATARITKERKPSRVRRRKRDRDGQKWLDAQRNTKHHKENHE